MGGGEGRERRGTWEERRRGETAHHRHIYGAHSHSKHHRQFRRCGLAGGCIVYITGVGWGGGREGFEVSKATHLQLALSPFCLSLEISVFSSWFQALVAIATTLPCVGDGTANPKATLPSCHCRGLNVLSQQYESKAILETGSE